MGGVTEREMLEELLSFNTPSITNVVATYPQHPFCLGLYNPWTENWYTDQSARCMYPELGPRAGYAVTCVYGLPDPHFGRLSFVDVIDAMAASKRPSVLVIEQKFPPELAGKVGLAGGKYDVGDEGAGLRGGRLQWPLAGRGRNSADGVPVSFERRVRWSRTDGRAGG